jgi:hypothetical protein
VTATLRYWRRAAVLLSTDKPLYQPDQTLHMRALVLDDQRRAWVFLGRKCPFRSDIIRR